jgi:hypothetical protein
VGDGFLVQQMGTAAPVTVPRAPTAATRDGYTDTSGQLASGGTLTRFGWPSTNTTSLVASVNPAAWTIAIETSSVRNRSRPATWSPSTMLVDEPPSDAAIYRSRFSPPDLPPMRSGISSKSIQGLCC